MANTLNKKVTIWINNKQIENNIASIQKRMTECRNEIRKMTIGTE